jgi:hypothetical protein
LYDLLTGASEFDENPLALAIVPSGTVQLFILQFLGLVDGAQTLKIHLNLNDN